MIDETQGKKTLPVLDLFTLGAGVELVLGWALIRAVDLRWIDFRLAFAVGIVASLVFLGSMAWLAGRHIDEAKQEVAERETELEAASARFQDSDRRFRRMADSLPEPAWVANAYGNLVWANRAWNELLGAEGGWKKPGRAWEWESVLSPDGLQNCSDRWREAVTTGTVFDAECGLRRSSDGVYVRYRVRALPLRDPSGKIMQWMGTCSAIDGVNPLSAAKPVRILVAEESTVDQAIPVRVLEQMGYLVTAVANGKEALGSLRKNQYDLILMDCRAQGMEGCEAVSEIRKRSELGGKEIPIIAISGSVGPGDREKFIEAGMSDYVRQPLNRQELERLVNGWLRRKTGPAEIG